LTSFTTPCFSSTKGYSSSSKENSPTEEKKTGTASLHQPAKTKTSSHDVTIGPKGKQDQKSMGKDELNAANFDLSLFGRLENFVNLDGADAVEPENKFGSFEDEITRLPDGRYCTPIPWTTDKWRLNRNLQSVAGRIESTLERFRQKSTGTR
jgi:hypothetical protein